MWPGAARGRGAAVKVPGGWQLVKAPGRGAGRGGGGAVEGQRPAGGRPLPGGGTCGRSGARGRQRGPAPPCRDCTRRGSGRHALGRRSRAATPGPSSRSRTPPSPGCQLPPPRPVRASRVEGRERARQSPLRIAAGKKDIVFQRPPVCITSHVRSTPSADRSSYGTGPRQPGRQA